MFNSTRKYFHHLSHSLTTSPNHELGILQRYLFSSDISRKPTSENAFNVNYFINKCGFPPEKAVSVSKYVKFEVPDKPDAVIALLKNQGFSEVDVFRLIRLVPKVVLNDPKKTLLPKIEFLLSQGILKADLIVMLPRILERNLDRVIIPAFYLLKRFFGSVENMQQPILRCRNIFAHFHSRVVPNIEYLQKSDIDETRFRKLLIRFPNILITHPDRLKEVMEEVKTMGFETVNSTYVLAIGIILGLSKFSWKKKIEVYKKWGYSEDEVLAAFVREPWCMSLSKDKIDGMMGFLINEMGFIPANLMQTPKILTYSLNRRIIPRGHLYRLLLSKGFKLQFSFYTFICLSEDKFRKICIENYGKEAPELLNLYHEKMKLYCNGFQI